MSILFEYGEWITVSNPKALKEMLIGIWNNRPLFQIDDETENETQTKDFQPFLTFDGNQIRAKNFVGFIQNGDELIEIFPKVFRNHPDAKSNKSLMLRHIFYWFSYCKKWRFPFSQANLNTTEIDSFPELIINLIANQFLETVENQPLSLYQPIEEPLFSPKGAINFSRYISNSLAKGKFHLIECDHEPFLFDNKLNRIIKYCSRLLMNQTKLSENLRVLQEIIFILEEVEDIYCNIHDAESVLLNSFFDEYLSVIESCKLILNQQLFSHNSQDLSQWCLLFPMEYIFEDFVAGFLEQNFSRQWKIEPQKSNLYLSDTPKAFQMRHDIFLTSTGEIDHKIILDTKYKLRYFNQIDAKKGISQSDLYQMVSYCFKRGCKEAILVYPNLSKELREPDNFEITSGFNDNDRVSIKAFEIPFWSIDAFEKLDKVLFDRFELFIL